MSQRVFVLIDDHTAYGMPSIEIYATREAAILGARDIVQEASDQRALHNDHKDDWLSEMTGKPPCVPDNWDGSSINYDYEAWLAMQEQDILT